MAKRTSEKIENRLPSSKKSRIVAEDSRGTSAEHERLHGNEIEQWRQWGPYLSERHWGTVREDHSPDGTCWEYFTHDDAVYRAYQSGEDGLLGICDDSCELCLAVALWNGKDKILKERLFGLTGSQGNHGEDVKEFYFYRDSTPTHSYMCAEYKYPQGSFPYDDLISTNASLTREDPEYELIDTGVFNDGYWDISMEYAKASPRDLLCRYTVCNRSSEVATVYLLPTIWFRNVWSGSTSDQGKRKDCCMKLDATNRVACSSKQLGEYVFAVDDHNAEFIFTENETNVSKIKTDNDDCDDNGSATTSQSSVPFAYTKDAFHEYVINGNRKAVNPQHTGTKCAAIYRLTVSPGQQVSVCCRLYHRNCELVDTFGPSFNNVIKQRKCECDDFYSVVISKHLSEDDKKICKQAYAGLCWTKQFYQYNGCDLKSLGQIRNQTWGHLRCADVISMPDKWEFPWFASWDLAFHMIPMCHIDPEFAKSQLLLFLSDRYQHPYGQIPAYEFDFSDVNPPVHGLACLYVFSRCQDFNFLKTCFHKLVPNFYWWLNQKDPKICGMFRAGFLGMDNISCFDRSKPPENVLIDQVDGIAWMATYAICMMRMAIELKLHCGDDLYQEFAISYLRHLARLSQSLNNTETGLWDEQDEFFYDRMNVTLSADVSSSPSSSSSSSSPAAEVKSQFLRIRSLVGLLPLVATHIIGHDVLEQLPRFSHVLGSLADSVHCQNTSDGVLVSLISRHQLTCILRYLLDEQEFFSKFGIRSLSKFHQANEFSVSVDGEIYSINYCPGDSLSDVFGGNSNWRGPIWLCMNYLLIDALETFSSVYDEPPSGLSVEICRRIASIFQLRTNQERPMHGGNKIKSDVRWNELVLFYEFYNAETGQGHGASHQTGWSALIVKFMEQIAQNSMQC